MQRATAAGRRVDCAAVARALVDRSAQLLAARRAPGAGPLRVCAVEVGHVPDWAAGARRHAQRLVARHGGEWDTRCFGPATTFNELLSAIAALNADPAVTGVLIGRPLPDGLSAKMLQQAVDPTKDIEGMHPSSIGRVVYGQKGEGDILWPCTAKASVEVLRQANDELGLGRSLQGLEALVVGNSDVLAKPIVSILHGEGATVTVCCPNTAHNFAAYTRSADAVFSAANVGVNTIRGDMLKPGSVLIDLGLNVDAAGRFLGGDAEIESCQGVAAKVSTLLHGVGVVRSAVLFGNLVHASLAGAHTNK